MRERRESQARLKPREGARRGDVISQYAENAGRGKLRMDFADIHGCFFQSVRFPNSSMISRKRCILFSCSYAVVAVFLDLRYRLSSKRIFTISSLNALTRSETCSCTS